MRCSRDAEASSQGTGGGRTGTSCLEKEDAVETTVDFC
jgi:hypothetical protein